MKEKEANDGSIFQDSNKLAMERQEKEKQQTSVRQTSVKVKELDGYVGFANLPNQVYRKAVKKGFEFTLMVVGESGLGKSTLINSMFLSDIYNQEQHPGPSFRAKKTVNVETTKVLLRENGVNLTLTVVDTPGFGDAVDNSNWLVFLVCSLLRNLPIEWLLKDLLFKSIDKKCQLTKFEITTCAFLIRISPILYFC